MSVANLEEYKLKLKHDGQVSISFGKNRFETNWKNKKILWSNLVAKVKTPVITHESYEEYKKLGKPEQDQIKDVGGYVGGNLTGGRRKTGSVTTRQLLTLDLDFAPIDFFDTLELLADYACCVYSTHKHSPESPRFRLLIPLDRAVTPDEYEAISRKVASEIGIDYFDDTTYQPSRLMYWPSVSSDGIYYYNYLDFPFLNADKILMSYKDWTDTSYWPESSRTAKIRKKMADKQGDPCEKPGLIGAFCRTYTIPEAIETFIPDAYIKCDMPNRYTYTGGSTAAGLVIYEDEKFAYSNHATDPASGKLCNAFDLVRIHKYHELDENVPEEAGATKSPSYKAMMDLIKKDTGTKRTIVEDKRREAEEDFSDSPWVDKIEIDKKGVIPSMNNLTLILQNDERINSIVFNQMADNLEIKEEVPWKHANRFWRDADDAQLEVFLAEYYCEFPKTKIATVIKKVTDDRAYHPIREYLQGLPEWDGVHRIDDLLIDYLGADDNEYVKAVTRKTLCAAIVRILNPGCKFDTMLVLNGPQGIGKSTLITKLGGKWFSDSLNLSDTKDKTAAEKLQGYWIIEVGELAGLRKMDVETLKSFLSRQDDKYRASYGYRVTPHLRQCIFIGTTNAEDGFLRDITGGRRFWPVNTPGKGTKKVWNIKQEEVDQMWAEVKMLVSKGEDLFLTGELEEEANKARIGAFESDSREGLVKEYLEKLLPENWGFLSIGDRREFLYGNEFGAVASEGTLQRKYVSNIEIWCECFGKPQADFEPRKAYEMNALMIKMTEWDKSEVRKRITPYGMQRMYERKKSDNLV